MKNLFCLAVVLFAFSFCKGKKNPSDGEYTPGKGYCVQKYGSGGCNVCTYDDEENAWGCTEKACDKTDKANAGKCLKYREKFVPKVNIE